MALALSAPPLALPHLPGILTTVAICWAVGALATRAPDPRDMKGKDDDQY